MSDINLKLEQKITKLEEQLAFTDQLVHELNNIVINMQQEQSKLKQKIKHLNNCLQRLQNYINEQNVNFNQDEIPPHY